LPQYTQRLPCPAQRALDSGRRLAQPGGDLGDAGALHAQEQHRAHLRAQRRLLEQIDEVGEEVSKVAGGLRGDQRRRWGQGVEGNGALLGGQSIEETPPRDGEEPGAETGRVAQAQQALVGVVEGLLRHLVEGDRARIGKTGEEGDELGPVGVGQTEERDSVALCGVDDV